MHRERHKDYLEELMRYGTEDPSRVHAHSCTHATAATPHTDKLATSHTDKLATVHSIRIAGRVHRAR